jgi:hypothetical protein
MKRRSVVAAFAVGCALRKDSTISSLNVLPRSIELGVGYICRTQIRGLKCTSTGERTPVVDNAGLVFVASFVAVAAANYLARAERKRLAVRIARLQRGGAWGYSVDAPVDSDDTAFAVRALLHLDPQGEEILSAGTRALSSFRDSVSGLYRTFHGTGAVHVVRDGGFTSNAQAHLGVNANILALLTDFGIVESSAVWRVWEECQDLASSRCLYYPLRAYTLFWLLPVIQSLFPTEGTRVAMLRAQTASLQERSGSWFEDPIETSLALHVLSAGREAAIVHQEPTIRRAILWLLEHQSSDGSWSSKKPVWEFPAAEQEVWRAFDSQRLIATSLAVQVLNLIATNQETQFRRTRTQSSG